MWGTSSRNTFPLAVHHWHSGRLALGRRNGLMRVRIRDAQLPTMDGLRLWRSPLPSTCPWAYLPMLTPNNPHNAKDVIFHIACGFCPHMQVWIVASRGPRAIHVSAPS
ncbi:hypothetical protein AVEN_72713-1 [Araneus ventricosus]|uniref:Uncharacterized protein n=1 Tax=Araneus ventricosus TaxID=182803 RepID=A0A4Y1ZV27_ARAVE|nr:hypothetical protein AVEN_72713-1 [Araneus ventricosus]